MAGYWPSSEKPLARRLPPTEGSSGGRAVAGEMRNEPHLRIWGAAIFWRPDRLVPPRCGAIIAGTIFAPLRIHELWVSYVRAGRQVFQTDFDSPSLGCLCFAAPDEVSRIGVGAPAGGPIPDICGNIVEGGLSRRQLRWPLLARPETGGDSAPSLLKNK